MSDELSKVREDFGRATDELGSAIKALGDQLGSAIKALGERVSALEARARTDTDTVTKTAANVTELSRGLSHVTDQVGILRGDVEKTHKHLGQQLAQALGLSKETV